MKYLLDTSTVIDLLRGNANVQESVIEKGIAEIAISQITLAELSVGIYLSKDTETEKERISFLKNNFAILPFTSSEEYGQIKASLYTEGQMIEDMDILIAAEAIRHKLVLITSNEKHFSRIPKLKLQNWR